jgi:hypothetical protein
MPSSGMVGPISRRAILSGPLCFAGTFGGSVMLDRAQAADFDRHGGRKGKRVDRELAAALNFQRKNSKNMGAVISPHNELLAGFGDNLFHYDSSTETSRLFHNDELVVVGNDFLEETGDLDSSERVEIGNKLSHTQIIKTTDDTENFSVATIEPVFDLDPEGNVTESFTGSTFSVVIQAGQFGDPTIEFQMLSDIRTDTFPNGIEFAGDVPAFDPELSELLSIAAKSVEDQTGFTSRPRVVAGPPGSDAPTRRCFLMAIVTFSVAVVCFAPVPALRLVTLVARRFIAPICNQFPTLVTRTVQVCR